MYNLSFARIMYGSSEQSRASNPVHHASISAEPARLELSEGWRNRLWRKQVGLESWLRKATPAWLSKGINIFLPNR